jgi:hypothetical protein
LSLREIISAAASVKRQRRDRWPVLENASRQRTVGLGQIDNLVPRPRTSRDFVVQHSKNAELERRPHRQRIVFVVRKEDRAILDHEVGVGVARLERGEQVLDCSS